VLIGRGGGLVRERCQLQTQHAPLMTSCLSGCLSGRSGGEGGGARAGARRPAGRTRPAQLTYTRPAQLTYTRPAQLTYTRPTHPAGGARCGTTAGEGRRGGSCPGTSRRHGARLGRPGGQRAATQQRAGITASAWEGALRGDGDVPRPPQPRRQQAATAATRALAR
jgi:hypothetical protein